VDPLIAAAFFVFGLAFGSFLNVCIHRMPRRILLRERRDAVEEQLSTDAAAQGALAAELAALRDEERGLSVAGGRSACPQCRATIAWYDNIPVVSWLVLLGRCRRCRTPITPRYLFVELLTAILFLACYERFGLSLAAAKYCVLSFLLLGLIFTDAEWKLLPDALTLPGLALGLIFSTLVPVNDFVLQFASLVFPWPALGIHGAEPAQAWRLASLLQSAIGALLGASFIYGAGAIYMRARGVEGMGFGDVKLMAMVGAFLGAGLTVVTVFAASLLGTLFGLSTILVVWMRRTRRRMERSREDAGRARRRAWRSAGIFYRYFQIPFGVFLGAMALAAAFFGNALVRWYWMRFL